MATALLFFICVFFSIVYVSLVSSLNNGLARKPPLGWRSWDCYHFDIDQSLITKCMDALLDSSRRINGITTSLAEIGYNKVGIDDGWQLCDSSGHYFHNETAPNGFPMVNTNLFPDLSAMIKYAHDNKLGVNWYFNNCHCWERDTYPANEENDVLWLRFNDFDGVKLDGCGTSQNTSNWNRLINETDSKPILTESGGNSPPPNNTNEDECPFNLFSFVYGGDNGSLHTNKEYNKYSEYKYEPNPSYAILIGDKLQSTIPYQQYPHGFISRPGCWAYPGECQVGNIKPQYNASQSDMEQTLFSAWSVASIPLIQGFDLTNNTIIDRIWYIITNNETLSVHQTWAGHPGRQIKKANYTLTYSDLEEYDNYYQLSTSTVTLFGYEIWAKPQPFNKWAVLLMNNDGYHQHDITVFFNDIPWNGPAKLRDIVHHKDLGSFNNSYTAKNVPPFASVFLLFS